MTETPLVDILSNLTTLSTSEARRMIVMEQVRVDGQVVTDPAARVEPPAHISCGDTTFHITE
jgi:ribosomal protein S4